MCNNYFTRDREQEWPVTAVLVEPAVGEFPDLTAPGLLELGRRSQPSSGTRSSGFRPGGACGDDGIASFDRIRYRRHDGGVFLYAFDLIDTVFARCDLFRPLLPPNACASPASAAARGRISSGFSWI